MTKINKKIKKKIKKKKAKLMSRENMKHYKNKIKSVFKRMDEKNLDFIEGQMSRYTYFASMYFNGYGVPDDIALYTLDFIYGFSKFKEHVETFKSINERLFEEYGFLQYHDEDVIEDGFVPDFATDLEDPMSKDILIKILLEVIKENKIFVGEKAWLMAIVERSEK